MAYNNVFPANYGFYQPPAQPQMARELRELMEDAPDESIKTEMRRLIQKVESM